MAKADGQPIAAGLFDQKAKTFVCRLAEPRLHDRELIARTIDSLDSVFREKVDIGVLVGRGKLVTSLPNVGVVDEALNVGLVFGQLSVGFTHLGADGLLDAAAVFLQRLFELLFADVFPFVDRVR